MGNSVICNGVTDRWVASELPELAFRYDWGRAGTALRRIEVDAEPDRPLGDLLDHLLRHSMGCQPGDNFGKAIALVERRLSPGQQVNDQSGELLRRSRDTFIREVT